MCVCLDEERLNGIVGGVEETCDAEQVGDVQLREEGAQVMQVGGQDGWLSMEKSDKVCWSHLVEK